MNIRYFKNPNYQEEDMLGIYKHDRGVEPGTTESNTSCWFLNS